ncbi:MAG: hypothetical protein KG075_16075 [Alphaproteobacteria bacterium]|nr:hypothetical protein [Alphaproteobacteria bacterium]
MAKTSNKKRREKTIRGSARSVFEPIIRPEPKTQYDFSKAFKAITLKDELSPEAIDRELQSIAAMYEAARERAAREVLPSEESKQLKVLGQLLHRANDAAKSLRHNLFHIPGDSTGGRVFRADMEAIVDRIDRVNDRRQALQSETLGKGAFGINRPRQSVASDSLKRRPGPAKDCLMQFLVEELANLWESSSGKLVPFSSNRVSFAEFVFAVTCALELSDVTMSVVKTSIRNWNRDRPKTRRKM